MRKAALIVSLISIPLYLIYAIYSCNQEYEKLRQELIAEHKLPYNFDQIKTTSTVIIVAVVAVLLIVVFILSQVLLSKGKKVAAGVITLLFLNIVAGILIFCIPKEQISEGVAVEGEGTTSGWSCPECGTRNVLVDVCKKCGYTSPDASKEYSQKIQSMLEEEEKNNTDVRSRNKCPYCGKVVSRYDESCPYCKHKLF